MCSRNVSILFSPKNCAISLILFTLIYIPPSSAQSDRSSLPIPEPTTMVMFFMAFGILIYRKYARQGRTPEDSRICVSVVTKDPPPPDIPHYEQLGRMTAAIVHDVKNALTGMRICAEILTYQDVPTDDRIVFAETLLNEVDRLTAMTQELLDFARGNASNLNTSPCALQTLLQNLLDMLQPDLTRRQIAVHTDFHDAGLCRIDCDKIKRACLNLLMNACEAMPDGGTLTVSIQTLENTVQVTIADTGCGISPELQARLFTPFVTSGKPYGTGLGLAIVKEILDAHQATIAIESQPDYGTTVHITFPGNPGQPLF